MRKYLTIANTEIAPGTRTVINLPLPKLSSHTPMNMPLHIIHGRKEGPVLFLSAAIHGDELNGIEIIRRVLATKALSKLSGTLIAIPVVNAYGLIQQSRYLPDRRDLNRSFPGSEGGSLAARLANLFMEEIVTKCTHGIDLHTGAVNRTNLPQIRADLDDPETCLLASNFGVPVLINSSVRDGSLRAETSALGIPVLLYEAGEALRYDEISIRAGVSGVINVMRTLGMLPPSRSRSVTSEPFIARKSLWVRAHESGMLRTKIALGAHVKKGALLGYIDDPFSGTQHPIYSTVEGVVIGRLELPLVYEGDATFHIACFTDNVMDVAEQVESFNTNHTDEPVSA
jgi:predicted deacylase